MNQEQITKLVERANAVSIFDVLRDFFGIEIPSEGKSWKDYCPFGFEHSDGGVDRSFRTYPSTNTAYCFAGHGFYNSVRLVQSQRDLRPAEAAKTILTKYGLLKPRNYRLRYYELQVQRERTKANVGNPAYLVEALHTSLSQMPAHAEGQYLPQFSLAMEEELSHLEQMLESNATEDEVRQWYAGARQRLAEILKEVSVG